MLPLTVTRRKRQQHAIESTITTSASFVEKRQGILTHGPWLSLEDLCFIEVAKYLSDPEIDEELTANDIHVQQVYNEFVNCIKLLGLQLPVCSKLSRVFQ